MTGTYHPNSDSASPTTTAHIADAVDYATDLNAAIGYGFAVDYDAARRLLAFVTNMRSAVAEVLRREDALSQEPRLGSSPAANVYKAYLPTIATDPSQGFLPVLAKLQAQLEQAATNIEGSLSQYEQNEQKVSDSMVNIHPI